MTKAYFDNNATTPLDPLVISSITRALGLWANPSSSNENAERAAKAVQVARSNVANMLNVESECVIFTSGGTESNNWVIESTIKKFLSDHPGRKPHIISSSIEHPSIRLPIEKRVEEGLIEVTWVDVDHTSGAVRVDDVRKSIREETCLVTIMLANNETGVIQPIEDISKSVREVNPKCHLHSDAAQAIGKIDVDIKKLGVDSVTVVGHKFYGPRIGALVFKDVNAILPPMFLGGGQERGHRSGTENVPMIVGIGEAARVCTDNASKIRENMSLLRNLFEKMLENLLGSNVKINFKNSQRLPNTSSMAFLGYKSHGCDLVSKSENEKHYTLDIDRTDTFLFGWICGDSPIGVKCLCNIGVYCNAKKHFDRVRENLNSLNTKVQCWGDGNTQVECRTSCKISGKKRGCSTKETYLSGAAVIGDTAYCSYDLCNESKTEIIDLIFCLHRSVQEFTPFAVLKNIHKAHNCFK